jgi:hypothetical protein
MKMARRTFGYILVAIFLLFVAVLFTFGQHVPVSLTQQYATNNHLYFGDRLPKDTIVQYGPIHLRGEMGETECGTTSGCVIRIDPEYNKADRVASLTLIHEQCHVDTRGTEFDMHGPKWQACMHRIADAGGLDNLW